MSQMRSLIGLLALTLFLAACSTATTTQAVPVTGDNQDLSEFQSQLTQALNQRDYDQLRTLMDSQFGLANWRSEGHFVSADEAIEQLKSSQLSADSTLVFDSQKDLQQMLGIDPLTIFGPDHTAVQAVLVNGWGPKGMDQALLLIGQRPDGSYYWQSALVASGGFNQ